MPPLAGVAAGIATTVTVCVTDGPQLEVKVITEVPVPTAFTMPVAEPTVATDGVALTHVPDPSVQVVVPPTHMDAMPVIAGVEPVVKLSFMPGVDSA